jgi:Ser/Thr protein kinase RdoA (MazF antagonist)
MRTASFDTLTPEAVVAGVERARGLVLDGTLNPYPSYVNRVYGLRTEEGVELVVKFYRPGRWTDAAILDEHRFLFDCAKAELPVVAPLADAAGRSLHEFALDDGAGGPLFRFALFPKKGGRNFDAESDDDWLRLGGLVGRLHAVGRERAAPDRDTLSPGGLSSGFVDELLADGHVHPKYRDEFESICRQTLASIAPLFEGVDSIRIHGDCHRGNILDRAGRGLLVIDFDDMLNGPPVQDLWLLLPGYAADCGRELAMLVDGYGQFSPFDRRTLELIEPLRFMRLIYFLAWRGRQRGDFWFDRSFPEWGNEAFWIKEVEDLRVQSEVVREALPE